MTETKQWQPIETAPSGQVLLLYFPEIRNRHLIHCYPERICSGKAGEYPSRPPTHWMPLPPIPQNNRR